MILKDERLKIILIVTLLVFLYYFCTNQFNQENFGGTCNSNYNIVRKNYDVKQLVQDCCDKSKDAGFDGPYINLKESMEEFPESVDNLKSTSIQNLYDITKISETINDFYNLIYNSKKLTNEQKKDIFSLSLNDINKMSLKYKKYNCLDCCKSQNYTKEYNLKACNMICNSKYT